MLPWTHCSGCQDSSRGAFPPGKLPNKVLVVWMRSWSRRSKASTILRLFFSMRNKEFQQRAVMSLLNCISLPECVWELWISLQQCLSKLFLKKKKTMTHNKKCILHCISVCICTNIYIIFDETSFSAYNMKCTLI